MRPIGRVKCRNGKRVLIVECDATKLPRLYSKVIDRKWKPVGKLVDIFGNIATPYAMVLCKNDCEKFVGEKLFVK